MAIAASRHSTKLFNDTQKSHVELLAEFVGSAVRDRTWYLRNNRAPRVVHALSLMGVPVNDTSVLFYNGEILCTSQSINFYARLGPTVGRAETVERAAEITSYLSALCGADGEQWKGDDYFRRWRPEVVVAKDARFERLYPAMFPEVALPEGIALSILQSDLNALRLMRTLVPDSDPLASATFKFRFTGTWQVVEALRSVLRPGGGMMLPATMMEDLEILLASEQVVSLQTKGARNLRNVLVHYGLGSAEPSDLLEHDPLLGLPQLFLDGAGWRECDRRLSEQIGALLNFLATWTGSFEHTLKEPHE